MLNNEPYCSYRYENSSGNFERCDQGRGSTVTVTKKKEINGEMTVHIRYNWFDWIL
ncbi:protein of unknown function [Acetoanaerobium sticklandii]|uniref:Uncharacterized protein n=1 Tax=Acetoanaerobium sticklandii (strain ATCC 12662 / DSM 519 / JCM 1433 / CCUG 9281 / NCIMB 10654 / HF) TaxID=499177 RepID=E3PVT5_ACESD|nr:protein of unknown function [Acetoanaerobium sticklandii]